MENSNNKYNVKSIFFFILCKFYRRDRENVMLESLGK